MRARISLLAVLVVACSRPPRAPAVRADARPQGRHFVLTGATVLGAGQDAAPLDLEIEGGKVVAVGRVGAGIADLRSVTGRFIVPAFIDSHVHLAYDPVGDELATRGIAGVVDLAAPLDFLAASHGALRVIASGPMLTAPDGYPLSSWGHDGYGLPCPDAAAGRAAVEQLHKLGAGLIKVPLTEPPTLDDATLAAVIARAHELSLRVAVHALDDATARRAGLAGADLLAHTPVEPLADATVAAWHGRAVIATLEAFGGGPDTVANLGKLRAAGLTVLYGTDLGNTREVGIHARELALMSQAGMSGADIVIAGTAAPASYFGFADLGALTPGKSASLMVLAADPRTDPGTLATPLEVYLDGELQAH